MSDNHKKKRARRPAKAKKTPEENPDIFHPTDPRYPKIEMPEPPKVPDRPDMTGAHPDCEGQVNLIADPSKSQVPPPPKGKARIMISIPLLAVTYEFFESFLRFWTQLQLAENKKYEIGYHFAYRKPVHMAEEYLVRIAQYNKCTHILFMDDDIYDTTPTDLDKLFDADKDIIGGIMHASKFPHAMCAFRRFNPETRKVTDMPVDDSMYRLYEIPCSCPNDKCKLPLSHWDITFCPKCGAKVDNMIQKVDLIPFAFTLMKLSIFDKLKQPWFHCTNNYPSDSWFADRVLEAGLVEYAHMGVRLNHAGVTDASKPHFVNMGMNVARQKQGVVALTPDEMETHQNLLMNKMKETEERIKVKPVFAEAGKASVNKEQPKSDTLVTHGR